MMGTCASRSLSVDACRFVDPQPMPVTRILSKLQVTFFTSMNAIQGREAHVPIIGHERCSTSDYWGNITQPDMICAGDQNTGACFGDSGGPLVCNDNGNHEYQLVGITSFAAGNRRTQMCRNKVTKPSVFTRVHSYKDWIQSHLHRHRLNELEDQVEALQRQLASLQVRNKSLL